jgi:prepilin-type N-terminal cleavage/methylation domain-containing protein
MKNQKGFTLIELLLVLAIIGIISAIAIPALLGQRARARDKGAQDNAVNLISDSVSSYDRASEAGIAPTDGTALWAIMTTTVTPLTGPTAPQLLTAKNPWAGTASAPNAAYATMTALTATDDTTVRGLSSGALGQVASGFLPPTAAAGGTPGAAGAVGSAVQLNATFKDGTGTDQSVFVKLGSID